MGEKRDGEILQQIVRVFRAWREASGEPPEALTVEQEKALPVLFDHLALLRLAIRPPESFEPPE
jgi:hypothetical protein